ncbi:hypothetical protein EJB05_22686, partial [Eragrostis curvula]
MENKVLHPFLCLVMVFHGHDCGLVRVWFPVTSFWMLVGFVFSHDESGEGGDDGMWMTVVDGEMAVFVQIGVLVCGISIWDDDPRWWNLRLFQSFLSPINGVGV